MSEHKFDLVVIGGGPGGYSGAILAGQKGLRTALIEKSNLGGTCLNRGCIPTKTLLRDTGLLPRLRQSHFLKGDMKISLKGLAGRKELVVNGSRAGIRNVLEGNGVTLLQGRAALTGPHAVEVVQESGQKLSLEADHILLAVGARQDFPAGLAPDGKAVWSTDDALTLAAVPKTLVVVGGGARGVELAQVYHCLGSRVVIMERDKRLLPRLDRGVTQRLRKILTDRKLKVLVRTEVIEAATGQDGRAELVYEDKTGRHEIKADKVLLALPRLPDLASLNLEAAGLAAGEEGLKLSPLNETAAAGLFLVGDAAGAPYLAHKAIAQARAVVNHLTGSGSDKVPDLIPSCVYGDPEIGCLGLTETELKAQGRPFRLGEFHFIGNGRANTLGRDQGLVRMFIGPDEEILGVHIIGPGATELISLAGLAMSNKLSLAQFRQTVFAHPSLAETVFEAALAVDGQGIHLLAD